MTWRKRFRSAISGRFVPKAEADASPSTTVGEAVGHLDCPRCQQRANYTDDGKLWYPLGVRKS
jgi:hypothetical protein